MRLAISTTETLTDLTTDLVVANNIATVPNETIRTLKILVRKPELDAPSLQSIGDPLKQAWRCGSTPAIILYMVVASG